MPEKQPRAAVRREEQMTRHTWLQPQHSAEHTSQTRLPTMQHSPGQALNLPCLCSWRSCTLWLGKCEEDWRGVPISREGSWFKASRWQMQHDEGCEKSSLNLNRHSSTNFSSRRFWLQVSRITSCSVSGTSYNRPSSHKKSVALIYIKDVSVSQ